MTNRLSSCFRVNHRWARVGHELNNWRNGLRQHFQTKTNKRKIRKRARARWRVSQSHVLYHLAGFSLLPSPSPAQKKFKKPVTRIFSYRDRSGDFLLLHHGNEISGWLLTEQVKSLSLSLSHQFKCIWKRWSGKRIECPDVFTSSHLTSLRHYCCRCFTSLGYSASTGL